MTFWIQQILVSRANRKPSTLNQMKGGHNWKHFAPPNGLFRRSVHNFEWKYFVKKLSPVDILAVVDPSAFYLVLYRLAGLRT